MNDVLLDIIRCLLYGFGVLIQTQMSCFIGKSTRLKESFCLVAFVFMAWLLGVGAVKDGIHIE